MLPKSARWKIVLTCIAFFLIYYSLVIVKVASQLPSPQLLVSSNTPLTTQILDRKGKVLYQIYEGRNRTPVKLADLPIYLIQATVAIEDKHFYIHPGVDPIGVIRAFRHNFFAPATSTTDNPGDPLQGGSTITQQLIKNTLLTPDQTWTRKLKEMVLAFWTEKIYSKNDILQMYLNEAPYGGPAWGVETAAKMYFGKAASDLNLAESAYLAGLPAAPTEYSPYGTHPEKGAERQKEVLRRMTEDGYITKTEADLASAYQLSFQPPTSDIKAPHFVMYVRSLLAAKYGERVVSQGGLKVITTLDLDLQEMAESAVASEISKLGKLKVGNGAAMITDPQSGEILVMVGSKDYFDLNGGNFNVSLAIRPPGSSIKPITYATAFKQGFTPGSIVLDTPTTFTNPWGQGYSPVNYDGRFHGPVTIRTALGSSYNIPAVKILGQVGIPQMLETAKDMGINSFTRPESYGLSLTLGGEGVKMIEMMGAYGVLASEGIRRDPQPIISVTDSQGHVLEDHQIVEGRRVLTEEVTYLLNDILSDNRARTPAFGINSLLKIDGQTPAVKTGTSDNKRDNWTFGYTPQYVVGVWVGNNDYSPMDPQLASGITGAAPIWHNIMENLLRGKPNLVFKRPAGIIETVLNGNKDLSIAEQTSKTVVGFQKIVQNVRREDKNEAKSYTDIFSGLKPIPSQTTQ